MTNLEFVTEICRKRIGNLIKNTYFENKNEHEHNTVERMNIKNCCYTCLLTQLYKISAS